MRENFCEWYRIVCVDPSNEQLKSRWESVQEYCEIEEINILELVKMFFGLPTDASFKKQFIDLYAKDLTFQSKNEREISLLAGVTIIELMEKEIHVTKIVLATMCIALFKQDAIIPDVQAIVSKKLKDITAEIRDLETEQRMRTISNTEITELKKSLELGAWNPQNIVEFSKVLSNIAANFNALVNNQNELSKSLIIFKEDSNILSWLFGEWSNDLDKPLNGSIKRSETALILGKELADLVEQIPGPYPAKAFLKKMLGHCKADKKNISLVEMVDSLDESWKELLLDDYNIINNGENTPILLSVSKALETNEPKVWKHAYQKAIGIDAEEMISDPLTWAYQMYLECLLVKYINREE
ncbi:hypothetical protein UF75_5281 [Desulfosporosinus sp. I2]|uniref:GTPase-associated system all-helical protein GASH n=1 Tax=Desulfosporosinus sp. I2 TaxID=1617025 RepID=UPI0005F0933C|nr:GTPase-associated system all-helical protein GASH [Desulfosporosinus sp. I2]KJR44333.1 hypothetical protein UF75_5281 [Desulfosporosinus sp. I2]